MKKLYLRVKREKNGDAMVVVLCILMVLLALSVTLLSSISTQVGMARKNASSERCRALAISLSDTICEEIVSEDAPIGGMKEYIQKEITSGEWDFFDEGTHASPEEVIKKFDAIDSLGNELGEDIMEGHDVLMSMYWIGDSSATYENIEDYDGIELVIISTTEKNSEMFKVETTYSLNALDGPWKWDKEVQK